MHCRIILQYCFFYLYLLNSSLSCICVKDTMVLVTLVPMFAPMIIGIAVFTGTFAATRPTMMEVDVEEDWKQLKLKNLQKIDKTKPEQAL